MNIFKKLGLGVATLLFAVTVAVPAVRAQDATSTPTLVDQIAQLLEQVASLQAQLEELQRQQSDLRAELREVTELTRNLSLGLTGEDVEKIQELLAEDSELYPEGLVTGYFGPLTEAAIRRLQARFGIDQVGVVGPITRGTLNQLFKNKGKGKYNSFATVTDDDRDDDDNDDNDVDFSEFIRGTRGVLICHKGKTLAIGGPAIQAHVRNHGDTIGSCGSSTDDDDDDDDDEETDEEKAQEAIDDAQNAIDDAQDEVDSADDGDKKDDAQALLDDANSKLDEAQDAFDDEDYDDAEELAKDAEELAGDALDALEEDDDIIAPVISNISATSTATTTATITWETDEDADSSLWYATSTGFAIDEDGVLMEDDNDLVLEHSIELTGLTASTTYYFKVGSEDESENEAMSDEESFTTLTE